MFGEEKVLQFFAEHLEGWELYSQPHINGHIPDIAVLCDLKEDCLKAEERLAEYGVVVTNAVANGADRAAQAKQTFTMRAPRVKICTFHSFKGWQSRLMVLSLATFKDTERSAALLYTMLTRLKKHPQGSSLTIVSSVPRLRDFGAKFSDFELRT